MQVPWQSRLQRSSDHNLPHRTHQLIPQRIAERLKPGCALTPLLLAQFECGRECDNTGDIECARTPTLLVTTM
jgi:hypothetical protein